MQDILKKQEVAAELRISLRSVSNMMAAKKLSYIKLGKAVRFERREIDAYLSRSRIVKTAA